MWRDNSQHNINIIFDPPTPERCSHNALWASEVQDPEQQNSWPLLTRDDFQVTWFPCSGEEVNITVTSSWREKDRGKKQRKGNTKHAAGISSDFKLPAWQIERRGKKCPTSPQSSSNGVVFKTFITNSLLLISQQQGLKLCLLSNWEPEASGSNQSKVLTAFLGRGWSQTRNYCTSVCNFKLL